MRITPPGTLSAKPKWTPSDVRTRALRPVSRISTRSSPSVTRIARWSVVPPGASQSTWSVATSGPDSRWRAFTARHRWGCFGSRPAT